MSANENQIVVYQPNETVRLDVRLENETVWLTQEQMVLLFGRDQSVIARHISNIFKEGELDRDSVYAKNAYTASDGKTYQVAYYNLDVVISVGYRVKSVQGTHFRQWATGVLKEYLIRGYAVNTRLALLEDKVDRRLAQHDQAIVELKDKVDFFVQTKQPPLQGVFYDGQLWDARALARDRESRRRGRSPCGDCRTSVRIGMNGKPFAVRALSATLRVRPLGGREKPLRATRKRLLRRLHEKGRLTIRFARYAGDFAWPEGAFSCPAERQGPTGPRKVRRTRGGEASRREATRLPWVAHKATRRPPAFVVARKRPHSSTPPLPHSPVHFADFADFA